MYNQRPAKFLQIISFVVLVGWVAAMLVVARLFYINRPLAAYLLQENGPFEIIGFFSCMLAGCLFLRTAFLQWASSRREAFWLAALAVGFLFLGMEEISWGQWFIGWETPATFEGNLQHETNLHNMSFIHFYAHEIGLAVFSIYFVIIPLIYHGIPMTSPLFDKIGLPIADLSIAALFATVFILFIRPFSLLYGASAEVP